MISISGIDCCGKSTQIELLCEELKSKGRKCEVVWSRGGYTPGIQVVKGIFRKEKNVSKEERIKYSEEVNGNPIKRKLLFIASLMDLWLYYSLVLRLKEIFGKTVICDRYIWDTYIDFKLKYPEYDFEHGFWWRLTLKTMVKPNPSLGMFIPAEESMRRSGLKDEPFPEPIDVRQKRIEMYYSLAGKNVWQWSIEATNTIDKVFDDIRKACI